MHTETWNTGKLRGTIHASPVALSLSDGAFGLEETLKRKAERHQVYLSNLFLLYKSFAQCSRSFYSHKTPAKDALHLQEASVAVVTHLKGKSLPSRYWGLQTSRGLVDALKGCPNLKVICIWPSIRISPLNLFCYFCFLKFLRPDLGMYL